MKRFAWLWMVMVLFGAAACARVSAQQPAGEVAAAAAVAAAAKPAGAESAAARNETLAPTPLSGDTETAPAPTRSVTLPAPSPIPAVTGTPDTRQTLPPPRNWAAWPLVPSVSARAKEIYRRGIAMGNDPRAFSTIGDCQSEPPVFMGIYDSDRYTLSEEDYTLEETIHHFKPSFTRDSITVKDGLSVASVLSPIWADPQVCEADETPLECELRLHKPSIMFINMGTNWKGGNDVTHEKYMRQIVEILLDHGVLPILGTKGDNQEGGHRINQSIARVAYDYDLPLWNFWRSIRDLPGKGIDGGRDGNYLTTLAWGRRSYTGLLALDAVWRAVRED